MYIFNNKFIGKSTESNDDGLQHIQVIYLITPVGVQKTCLKHKGYICSRLGNVRTTVGVNHHRAGR